MKKQINQKGITLIALVITIIVLLILAGVSIAMLMGENGILTNTNKAKVENAHGAVREAMQLEYTNYNLEKKTGKGANTLVEYFQEKEIIGEPEEEGKYVIDVEKLLGTKPTLGLGTDGKDVYKLEEVTNEEATGSLGKIASIKPIKLAEATPTSTGKTYKVTYYGKTESEKQEIEIFSDINEEAKNVDVVFEITYFTTSSGHFSHEFTVKSGTTWGELVETSEYFKIHNDEFICLSKAGKELIGMSANDVFLVFDPDSEGPPVATNELIGSKTYRLEPIGG